MSGLGLGLGLGLGAHRKVGGEPYSDVLALEYDLTQITEPTTIAIAIKADSSWFDTGQEVTIDWGDGSELTIVSATSGQSGYIGHEYASEGNYIVKIAGSLKLYGKTANENITGQELLTHIRSFGNLGIVSFVYAFFGCTGLISVPKYLPSSVRNMNRMFPYCSGDAFNPDVSAWDVSKVTDMYSMFNSCSGASFNPDVSLWDVSKVTNMYRMFRSCSGAAFSGGRGEGTEGIEKWTPNSLSSVTTSGLHEFMLTSRKQEDGFLDSILIAWAALIGDAENPLPENITCHFGTNTYTAAAEDAIGALEAHGTTGWVITSGGLAS